MCLVSSRNDLRLLPALVEGGVDAFQVRDKELSTRELVELTERVLELDVVVIVNDRLDVVLAAGAHGVHLGADDLSVATARRLAPDIVIGATCRDHLGVQRAVRDGADYVGVGPVFTTTSKEGLPDPLGLGALAEAVGPLPVFAIGGITADRVEAVMATGVHGVAVISGIWSARNPVAAAATFAEVLG